MSEKGYFCTECEREHTRGKIFKDHLQYAENEVDLSEYTDLGNINKIKNVSGIGDSTFKKILDAGYNTLEDIAISTKKMIMENCDVGEKTAIKLLEAAQNIANIGLFKTGWEVYQERKNMLHLTTGSKDLDDLLGGGIETGTLTEFFGEYRTGKTQLCHQLCVNVQLPKEKGGLDGNPLYIDAEGTFRGVRVAKIAEALSLDIQQTLENVQWIRAYNSDHQMNTIKKASKIIREKNVKLIIIDSLITHFRGEYIGRGTLADRQQHINVHIHDLDRLCSLHKDLCVIVTNQVSANPDSLYGGKKVTATGGHIVAHGITTRIYLRKGKGDQRIARVEDAPHLPPGEAIFQICDEGVR